MIKKLLNICFILIFTVPLVSHAEDALSNKGFSFKGDSSYSRDKVSLGFGGEYKTKGFTFDSMAYSSPNATISDFKSNALSINKVKVGVSNQTPIYKDILFLNTELKMYVDTKTGLVVNRQSLEVVYYF